MIFVHYSLFILDTLLKSPISSTQAASHSRPAILAEKLMQFCFCLKKKYRLVGLYFILYCSEMLKTDTTKKIHSYSFDISHSMLCDIVPDYFLEMGKDNSVLPF